MKKIFIVLLTLSLIVLFSCKKATESDNTPPTVEITYPANNSQFIQGELITITAEANDDEGVEKVEFYIDGTKESTDYSEPYQYDWDTGQGKGVNYTIYAKVYDTSDNISNSESVNVTIKENGTVTDVEGNVYQTKIIGSQEWMIENLKVTQYRNGDPIPNVTDSSIWIGLSSGAYCYYDNNPSNADTYGALYNWYAVDDVRGLAPEGWHVPNDDEWQELVDCLGGSYLAGGKMKETGTAHWDSPNTCATNESGFTALPGGDRSSYDGYFYKIGKQAWFWSSQMYYRLLYYISSIVDRTYCNNKESGFSIRCVKD